MTEKKKTLSQKVVDAIKKKVTDKKNKSPVSNITRAAQKREAIYKDFYDNF